MERKTRRRLEKRWLAKPLHHIDTSVFLESLTPKSIEQRNHCERYLARLGKIYRGSVSTLILGEFTEAALKSVEPELLLNFLPLFIRRFGLGTVSLKEAAIQKAANLLGLETRLEMHDVLHLTIASQEGAAAFVTIDQKLIGHHLLEKELGLKILHPKELI